MKKVLQNSSLANDVRFKTNALRSANRAELTGLIEQAFSSFSAAQVAAKLNEADIATNMNNMHDL